MVDVVLEGSGIDEKFLGVTLFALVPNTTEFMNAISFAMNGNIALRYALPLLLGYPCVDLTCGCSMEIGSAYALQVCLLQIPAMVAFSAWYAPERMGSVAETFTYVNAYSPWVHFMAYGTNIGWNRLIFPRWDIVAIILSVFLMTYTYIEAKSNYHRGSILVLRSASLLSLLL